MLLSLAPQKVNTKVRTNFNKEISKLSPFLQAKKVKRLGDAFSVLYDSNACSVPWQIMMSVAFNESSFNSLAINNKSKDYGLTQISSATIKRLRLDKTRLLTNEVYALKTACSILENNQKHFGKKTRHWLGIYRSGTNLKSPYIQKNMISYDKLIRKTARFLGYYGH